MITETIPTQKTLSELLNDLLRDCQPVLRGELFFEQEEEGVAQLKWQKDRISEPFSITEVEERLTPGGRYSIEVATVVRGVRYTRNGDGWPDEVDVNEIGSADTVLGAFNFLIVAWFREQIARCLESAAETRILEQQEKELLSESLKEKV